jgi:hypothetical protein
MCADKQDRVETGTSTDTVLRCLHRFAQWLRGRNDHDEEPTTICARVLRAAHDQAESLEAATHIMSPALKPRVEAMLALISYCYAKGLLDSAEIEQRLWQDEAFLSTFGNDLPSAQKLRAFRRRHRQNILAIVEQALQESRLHASKPSSPAKPLATEPAAESARRKAEQLLDMANVMDHLATD